MFGREKTEVMRGLMVVGLAALLLVAFAYPAYAFSAGTPLFTYTGKIVAIDDASRFVAVQAGPNDMLVFGLERNGAVLECNEPMSFEDLKVGDDVTISYYETSANNFIAQEINSMSSEGILGMPECCS